MINNKSFVKIINSTKCPICLDINIEPRVLKCGHSVCIVCIHSLEETSLNDFRSTNRIPTLKCPLCRDSSIALIDKLPINQMLKSLLSSHEDYKKRLINFNKNKKTFKLDDYLSKNLNLTTFCDEIRIKIAIDLYELLLPKMFNEIKNGSNFITIDEENIVKKFDRVSELIVPLLFKHNIYSVHVEHNSLVKKIIIEITKNSSELHSRRFINRNWNNNSSRSTK